MKKAGAHAPQCTPECFVQNKVEQEVGGTMAADEKDAADFDFFERVF